MIDGQAIAYSKRELTFTFTKNNTKLWFTMSTWLNNYIQLLG